MNRVVLVGLCVLWCGRVIADQPVDSAVIAPTRRPVQRVGQLAKIRPDRIEVCKRWCAEISPEVREALRQFSIQNYSIYLKQLEPGQPYLFAFFEYTGDNYHRDRAKMRQHPQLRHWHRQLAKECLEKISDDHDSLWIDMKEVFYFEGRDDIEVDDAHVQRSGRVIGVRPEMVEGYNQLHAHPWTDLLDVLRKGNLRNYPIYMVTLGDKVYIFGYFEYVGKDFDADMKLISSAPVTVAWIKFTDEGCQLPLATRKEGEWWAEMEQILYLP